MTETQDKERTVEIGSGDVVVIDKLFGPLIFADLRITADIESGDWIIEREWIATGEFLPWCRIPGQIAREFAEADMQKDAG